MIITSCFDHDVLQNIKKASNPKFSFKVNIVTLTIFNSYLVHINFSKPVVPIHT